MDRLVTEPFSIFRGRRVLVTGHTGFKGSWLSLWLHLLGAELAGYALEPEPQTNLFHMLDLASRMRHVRADIRDYDRLRAVFHEFQPEFVFHLAAQALVRQSYEQPKLTFDTNVGGAVNLLEAIRSTPSVRAVVFVTSDKCYRNKEWIWGYRENDELGGHDPYSASKAAAELIFSSYLDSFFRKNAGLGIATVRAGNVIGGGDGSRDRIVPDCMHALRNGIPIVLRNPHATRPWQHVLDPLCGYLTLAARLYENQQDYSGSWNFGPDADSIHTVREVAEKIISFRGDGRIVVQTPVGAPHEHGLLHLNCDKAQQMLGWRLRWEFDRAIEQVVRWYQEIDAGTPALEVTRSQIEAYAQMLPAQRAARPALEACHD
jgi:CDP-glucose 4,6-dehydratase